MLHSSHATTGQGYTQTIQEVQQVQQRGEQHMDGGTSARG